MLKEVGATARSDLLGREVSNYGGRQLALEPIRPRVRGLLLAGGAAGRALAGPGHHLRQLPGFPKGDLRGRTVEALPVSDCGALGWELDWREWVLMRCKSLILK